MKEINMTKAISCMPDKFITMEMVELAATEHRPELVNYLPEKYITSEILDSIFKTDDYGWRSWQLSKIPEEKRNRQICLRAIKAEKSNFPDIPEKYRNSDILESLFAHRNFMHYLHLIPSSSWNNGTVRDAIYSLYRDVQQTEVTGTVQRGMNSSSYMKQASCFLSFRDKPRISDFGKN